MRLWLGGPRILGIRTGVILDRRDFERVFPDSQVGNGQLFDPDHSFLYVVKGDHGRCKIGLTANPTVRLAQLQTGSAFPIQFAWIGAPRGDATLIERDAHEMLSQYRSNGEWFNVSPDAAVGAINAAAQRRGHPILGLTPEMAEQIRIEAAKQQTQRRQPLIYNKWFWIVSFFVLWALFWYLLSTP